MTNRVISETYDLFEIGVPTGENQPPTPGVASYDATHRSTIQPETFYTTDGGGIDYSTQTNPFSGFWNDNNFSAGNPNFTTTIKNKHFAPNAYDTVRITDEGIIECYPPPINVAGWKAITFKKLNYSINGGMTTNKLTNPLYNLVEKYQHNQSLALPKWSDTFEPEVKNPAVVQPGSIQYDPQLCPIFVKWDEYPSRSKVVLSKDSDPIRFVFSYPRAADEPIRLYITATASITGWNVDKARRVIGKLSKADLGTFLSSCNWVIEWEQVSDASLKQEA